MKKLLVIMIATMVTAIAASAFAVTPIGTGTANATVAIGGATFTPSANVVISAASITTAYVCTSAHNAAASSPGYQFQIDSTYNGIQKKQWATGEISTGSWPTLVTSATASVPGFQ